MTKVSCPKLNIIFVTYVKHIVHKTASIVHNETGESTNSTTTAFGWTTASVRRTTSGSLWVLCLWPSNCYSKTSWILYQLQLIANNTDNYFFEPSLFFYVVQLLLLLVGVIGMLFVAQLSIFHLWLRWNGLTTFEFICIQREHEEFEAKKAQENENTNKNAQPSGGTTHLLPSGGYTSNTAGVKDNFAKFHNASDEGKNILHSDEDNQESQGQLAHALGGNKMAGTIKRQRVNVSSDQFLNLNAVK